MPREKEAFRDNLERIDAMFPGKELLTRADVVRGFGLTRKAVERMLAGRMFDGKYISKAALARLIS
jgi:hypothetical protein